MAAKATLVTVLFALSSASACTPDLDWASTASSADAGGPDGLQFQPQPDGSVSGADSGVQSTPPKTGPDCKQGANGSTFCAVKAGAFLMGSPSSELCRQQDERQHRVKLTNAFELAAHEVTRDAYAAVMGEANLPAINWAASWQNNICTKECYFKADRLACSRKCPVTNVNWHQAAAYCNQLALKDLEKQCQICVGSGANQTCRPADPSVCQCYRCTGEGNNVRCTVNPQFAGNKIYNCPGFRLPTEAEWEYSYRADTTTAFYGGAITQCKDSDDPVAADIGWYKRNAYLNVGPSIFIALHPGKQKRANAWGVYDMAGNLAEWTHSLYSEYPAAQEVVNPNPISTDQTPLRNRVVRGGYYDSDAADVRAAARHSENPDTARQHYGFRCVRTVF